MDDLDELRQELAELRTRFGFISNAADHLEDMPHRITELEQENRALRIMVENVLTRLVKVERSLAAPGIVPQQHENATHSSAARASASW
jgi:hypothetical protein